MPSIYKTHGLSRELDPIKTDSPPTVRGSLGGKAYELKRKFRTGRNSGGRGFDTIKGMSKLGFFVGVEALQDLVNELNAGHFDGLKFCFGQSGRKAEIVAQQIKFDISATAGGDNSTTVLSKGTIYTSVSSRSTEPPVAECPPLKVCLS
jgi:hypothetical protein